MKILHLSDIHIDVNSHILGYSLWSSFMKELKTIGDKADLILISGDISNDMKKSLKIVDEIKVITGKKVLFVPGNHDIWVDEYGISDSNELYDTYLNHSSCLVGNPYIMDNWAIVGSMGWYDYSFGIKGISNEEIRKKKKRYWADDRYAVWGRTDEEQLDIVLKQLETDLNSVSNKKIWLTNHFLPFEEYLTYKNRDWNFCNAYMGSSKLGDLIKSYDNIKIVSFGHTHRRFETKELFGKTILCKPVGYVGEWYTTNFNEELKTCSVYIDLNEI